MPELAEVEFYRKQWDCGKNAKVLRVSLHGEKRIFRFADPAAIEKQLVGARLLGSEASGKQMLFRFSRSCWMGIHLGMTGKLSVGPRDMTPLKHDHLVLFQSKRALAFSDMRQFGLVRFARGKTPPEWWTGLARSVTSPEFTQQVMSEFLAAHSRLPIKATLLLQKGFPGIGNWMADEILWHARMDPHLATGKLDRKQKKTLWTAIRFVCNTAMKHIGSDYGDAPKNWLFHERWSKTGRCPRDKQPLAREIIGSRTTAWCKKCQST